MSRIALKRANVKALHSAESAQTQSGASLASLKVPARRYVGSFASSNEAKPHCATSASHFEAKRFSEAILASPAAKKIASRAKSRAFQSKQGSSQPPRVSVLD